MSFLHPTAFLLALLLPGLVLLYFLKLKRPEVSVPSILLWQKVLEEMRVNSPFQRLRRSLLLLLQLVALSALILALAEPVRRGRTLAQESLLVLLDTSASMLTLETHGRTRLELAEDEARRLSEVLKGGGEMMLIGFDASARVLCPFTEKPSEIEDALRDVKGSHAGSRLGQALLLAQPIAITRSNPRIVVLSDGAFQTPEGVDLSVPVECVTVGEDRSNVALIGLDVRRSVKDRANVEMFVSLENFSPKAVSGAMTVKLDGRPLDRRTISISAGGRLSQVFKARWIEGGVVEVQLEVKDALPCDNKAWQVVPPLLQRNVLLVGERPSFVERALKACPDVKVRCVSSPVSQEEMQGFFMVVWDGVRSADQGFGHNIYLGCAPSEAEQAAALGKERQEAMIVDWDRRHSLNRFLDFDNLMVGRCRELQLPIGSEILLQADHGPLIGLYPDLYGQTLVTSFRPTESNWPLLVSFPLFLANCLNYFEEMDQRMSLRNMEVGRPIVVQGEADRAALLLPEGGRFSMSRSGEGTFTSSEVSRVGVYAVELDDEDPLFVAVNLFDSRESDLNVVEQPLIPGERVIHLEERKKLPYGLWKVFASLLAVLLAVEWTVYHRRWFV